MRNAQIFDEKNWKMYVLIFCTTFVWNIYHSKKNWAGYGQKCLHVFMYGSRYFLTDFNKSWIFTADIRKIFKYEISRKFVQWEQSCSTRTGRQTLRIFNRVAFPILRKRMIAILKPAGSVIAQFSTQHCALQITDIRESCIISRSINAWHRFISERGTEKASLSSVRSDNFLWIEVRPYE